MKNHENNSSEKDIDIINVEAVKVPVTPRFRQHGGSQVPNVGVRGHCSITDLSQPRGAVMGAILLAQEKLGLPEAVRRCSEVLVREVRSIRV